MQIYRILNKIDGKSYIGQTQHTFEERYNKYKWWQKPSNKYLINAAEKYGIENFEIQILKDDIQTLEELNINETYYANLYNTYRPNGYNIRVLIIYSKELVHFFGVMHQKFCRNYHSL